MAPFCALKLILIGESGVGKTCLLLRFVDGIYKTYSPPWPTIIDLKVQVIEVGDKSIKLEIWDTAGQERYRAVSKEYYRNSDGVILMYDVTDIESYYKTSSWLSEIRKHTDGVAIIVGNKNEDPTSKSVQTSVVRSYAKEEGLEFIETSAKTGHNVNKVFEILVKRILQQKYPTLFESTVTTTIPEPSRSQEISNIEDVIKLTDEPAVQKKSTCC